MSDKMVLHVRDRRSVWSMPGWVPEEIRAALPKGWSVVLADQVADGAGDGGRKVPGAVLDELGDARVYLGFGVPADVLRAGPGLEWVHSVTAGIGSSLTEEMRERDVVFTNSAGVHGPPIAETVIAMVLYFFRGLDFAEEGKRRGEWSPEPFWREGTPIRELSDSVVGILGYGGIGREVARRASALGARVLALRRHAPVGADAYAEVLHGPGAMARILGRSDVLVVALPETDETRGILDRKTLSAMKEGAILVNVARGRLVDDDALVEALRSGRLRGAALDAFAREPLPEDHSFWTTPNLLLTPHVSAVTTRFWRRETDLVVENVQRFLDGRPLLNVVDKAAGY